MKLYRARSASEEGVGVGGEEIMKRALFLFASLCSTALAQAGTGKPCGESYIHNTYTCHKDTGSASGSTTPGWVPIYFQEVPTGVLQRETVTAPSNFQPLHEVRPVTAIQIVDGANFLAYSNYQSTNMRLAGIKLNDMSPELMTQASQYLTRLIPPNSSVLIESRPDRSVYVWLMGELVNLALVEHGFAKLDTSTAGDYDDILATGLKYAQARKIGLWANP